MIAPPVFKFKGNKEKALYLKSQALQFYYYTQRQMETGGLPYTYKRQVLPDGSVIEVMCKKEGLYGLVTGTVHIITSTMPVEYEENKIYLESGYYDLLSVATCTEASYKPAILHYNTSISNYISSLDKPVQGKLGTDLNGEKLLDGYTSKSVGGDTLTNTTVDFCSNTYTSNIPIYSPTPEITRKKKQIQNRIPSSFYSGKMRLFIQSLYGSKRDDYRINLDVNDLPLAGDYNLYLIDPGGNSFQLVWDYPYTCGIYTTSTYDYYLLKVGTNDIYVYPLGTSADYIKKALNSKSIQQDSILVNKLEAYLLSTATLDTSKMYSIPIKNSISIGGTSLGYGWKFSKSGKECRVVIHEDISPTTNGTLFKAHELKVSISEVGGKLTATMTETNSGTWFHGLYFVAWRPEYSVDAQYQYGTFNNSATMSSTNTPLYGWYEEESYKSINLTANITVRTDTVSYTTRYVSMGCNATDLSSQYTGTYNGSNGTVGLSGISSVSVSWRNTSSASDYNYYWSNDIAKNDIPESSQTSSNVGIYMCDTGSNGVDYLVSKGYWEYPGGPYAVIKWTDQGTFYSGKSLTYYYKYLAYDQINRGATSDYGKIALIIPLKDSESISICYKQVLSQEGSTSFYNSRDSGNTGSPSIAEEIDVKWDKATGQRSIVSRGTKHHLTDSPVFNIARAGTQVGNPASTTEEATLISSKKEIGDYRQLEDGYIDYHTLAGSGSSSWSNEYIAGTFGQPLVHPLITRSSYNGGTITEHSQGATGKNINGYRNHTAIGWA